MSGGSLTIANSPVVLLDANVLIALSTAEHLSHDKAHEWWSANGFEIATCPITQGALVRFYARQDSASGALTGKLILRTLESDARHHFWPDDLPYSAVPDRGLRGHNQITDMYLA